MSKRNRKERTVTDLSEIATIVSDEGRPEDPTALGTAATATETKSGYVPDQPPGGTSFEPCEELAGDSDDDPEVILQAAEDHRDQEKEDAGILAFAAPAEVEELPNPGPDGPAEAPPTEGSPTPSAPLGAMAMVEDLRRQVEVLKAAKGARRVASGSKPRPNVTYTLLSKPPNWHGTPQVAQLQQILFDEAFLAKHRGVDGTVKVQEPELFAQVEAGHAAGILRTKQDPVRIFQYYRTNLLNANSLRWA